MGMHQKKNMDKQLTGIRKETFNLENEEHGLVNDGL